MSEGSEGLESAVPKVSAADAVVIEKAVEAYFGRLSRWLVPLGTAVAVVGLVVATTIPDSDTSAGGSADVVSMGPMGGADVPMNALTPTGDAMSGQAGGAGATPGGRTPPTGAAGGSPGAGSPAGGAGSTAGNAGGTGPGRTGDAPRGGGVSRTGTACVDGARQFAWSKYAPMCTAAFSGPNGGATSHGVTADEIKIIVGLGNAAENSAIQSLAGPATPDDGNWAKTIAMYADYFNSQFETYGRKVVVETYQMKSDYILADMGRDTASAQADAQKAKALGAFIDLTALTNTSSVPYGNALAELGVISWTFPLRTADDYAARSPYLYNFLPDGSKWAKWATNLVCRRMAGMPAAEAGGEQKGKPRKFGLIEVSIPEWKAAGEMTSRLIKEQCGAETFNLTYDFDLGTFSQYGASMMAQMRRQDVTTILCVCDPLGPIFMTQSATDDGYFPEWIFHNQGIVDSNYDAKQLEHSFSNGPALPPAQQSEAFRVFRTAYPGADPPSRPYFTWIYGIMLQVFSAVQAAGPELTPQSFSTAMRSLPPSLPGGDYGPWWGDSSLPFGGGFTPWTGMQVTRWGVDAPSPDGAKGYWAPCPGNTFYPFTDLAAWGEPGTPIDCPA